jgi:glyoxylase-like metal-dependent hydrolase (beta-lactamase superfamily II)
VTGAGGVSLREIAAGVFVARTEPLDVNVTLVVGDAAALVVDTLSTEEQAGALLAAVRAITDRPLAVVNTHFHFDHCFGNNVVGAGGPVYGHPATIEELATRGAAWQRRWHDEWVGSHPGLAAGLAAVTLRAPDRPVREAETLDLGGRTVTLSHPGPGHTAGDLVVHIPDADVLVAGDLVEEGNPPDFGDASPLEWPEAVATLLRACGPDTIVVPGHGAVVDRDFVTRQHADLAALDWLIREAHADGATVESAASRGPFPRSVTRTAVSRGFAALDGTPPTRTG